MVTTKDIQVLDMFMQAHDIPYVLTGTAALMVHGILPEGYVADDIDVIVLVNKKEDSHKFNQVEKTLTELQSLSGNEKCESYDVITFNANGIKVNAFMNGREYCKQEDGNTYNYVGGFGEEGLYRIMIICGRRIKVSCVNCILTAKFRLRRMKDYMFAKDLASTILNIGF